MPFEIYTTSSTETECKAQSNHNTGLHETPCKPVQGLQDCTRNYKPCTGLQDTVK